MRLFTRVAGVAGAFALAAAGSPAAISQPDTRPPCVHDLIALLDTIDSATAHPGDVFEFRLVEPAVAPDGTPLPAGQLGYGVIANATHANKGGQPGYLALETRFLLLADGRHIPVLIDRHNDDSSAATGATANAPWALGLIPFVGYAAGGYDALHHGRDAAIPRGTRVSVVIGDDAALGKCRLPAPGESPPPAAAAPAPTPAPAPVVTPAAPPRAPSAQTAAPPQTGPAIQPAATPTQSPVAPPTPPPQR
ncbi:MAG TPA: hypothetical protein VFB22_02255 [Candidatus Baltobacteraceae bacterium]|nr:hypothetical protein [Candidatus Baltobacteraceae bacterium]